MRLQLLQNTYIPLPHIMSGRNSWQKWMQKIRHCQPMYKEIAVVWMKIWQGTRLATKEPWQWDASLAYGNVVSYYNKVNLRRARLVLKWTTPYHARFCHTFLVFTELWAEFNRHRSTIEKCCWCRSCYQQSAALLKTVNVIVFQQDSAPAHRAHDTQCSRIPILRFFSDLKNTFLSFLKTCQKVGSKSLVVNPSKWVPSFAEN